MMWHVLLYTGNRSIKVKSEHSFVEENMYSADYMSRMFADDVSGHEANLIRMFMEKELPLCLTDKTCKSYL